MRTHLIRSTLERLTLIKMKTRLKRFGNAVQLDRAVIVQVRPHGSLVLRIGIVLFPPQLFKLLIG